MLFLALACSPESSVEGIATLPDNYAAMYVQIGDGTVNPLDPAQNPSFQEVYDTYIGDDADAFRADAYAWFEEASGWTPDDPELEGRVLFSEVAAPPGAGYRIAMSTWEDVPPEGLSVTDVGITALVVDPSGVELGGSWDGWFAPPGTLLTYGTYLVHRGDEEVRIPFHSASPGSVTPDGKYIVACEVDHPEIGTGLAMAVATIAPLETGEMRYEIRNVFTFAP